VHVSESEAVGLLGPRLGGPTLGAAFRIVFVPEVTDGPVTVLTFRSSGAELDALGNAGHPYFRPVWFPDIAGMVIDDDVDWDEVAELVRHSYCVMAPKMLAALVDRPGR